MVALNVRAVLFHISLNIDIFRQHSPHKDSADNQSQ